MPNKIPHATKQLALAKLREGLSRKEVSDLTGVSTRTIERWQAAMTKKPAKPARNAPPATPPADTPAPAPQNGAAVDFEASPAPVEDEKEQKSIVDQGLDTIKGLLGMGDKQDTPAVVTAKLDPKRQQFVDSITPIAGLGFITVAGIVWYRIGPEYKMLAPDEPTAQRIVEPLLRIYARHASFLAEVNPDVADVGASLVALVGYVHVSLSLYQKIKEEQQAFDEQNGAGAYRAYRTGASVVGGENGAGHQNGRYADVSRASENHAGPAGQNGGHTGANGGGTLSPKEQRQFEALSLLAQRDYESRARRSGQFQ